MGNYGCFGGEATYGNLLSVQYWWKLKLPQKTKSIKLKKSNRPTNRQRKDWPNTFKSILSLFILIKTAMSPLSLAHSLFHFSVNNIYKNVNPYREHSSKVPSRIGCFWFVCFLHMEVNYSSQEMGKDIFHLLLIQLKMMRAKLKVPTKIPKMSKTKACGNKKKDKNN